MNSLMALVIGWTLVGAFVFTVLMTCLSLVGWVKFADRKQQQKLFQVLVVELVLGGGAKALGIANFDPQPVEKDLKREGANAAITGVLDTALASATEEKGIDRETAAALVERIDPGGDAKIATSKAELVSKIRAMPEGRIRPGAAQDIRVSPSLHGIHPGMTRRMTTPDR